MFRHFFFKATALCACITTAIAVPEATASGTQPVSATKNTLSAIDEDSLYSSLPDLEVIAPMHANSSVIVPQTLGGHELEQLNSHNVADAIRYFSGVQIKDYGGV